MKKITAFLLALLLTCGTMIGCQMKLPDDKADTAETLPQFEDVIKEYDQDDSQQGFSIKRKRYYYKGNAVMDEFNIPQTPYPAGEVLLLNVKNETDTNYSATLTVTYFDENGEKIKTEKQVFKEFAAGFQKYCLFKPQNSYASYACELTLTEYTGEIWADKIYYSGICNIEKRYLDIWKYVHENDDYSNYPSVDANIGIVEQPHPELNKLSVMAIIFDNTGEIYIIQQVGWSCDAETEEHINYRSVTLYQTTEKELVWPEELKGELQVIVVIDVEGK